MEDTVNVELEHKAHQGSSNNKEANHTDSHSGDENDHKEEDKDKEKGPKWWGWQEEFTSFHKGIVSIAKNNKILSFFLIAIPFGIASPNAGWGDIPTFILTMIAIIPLAKYLGEATEQLAMHTNQTLGGLLNATFGNAVELIVAIIALKDGLIRVVQTSLLGSILSNLLLVMGMSFFFGGLKYKEQHFNKTASLTSTSLLFMAVMGLVIPAAFIISQAGGADNESKALNISRIASLLLLAIYISYLFFQLKTHNHLYEDDGGDQEEEEEMLLSLTGSLVLLAAVTVLVAVLAEYLVDSINSVASGGTITETFIGIVLLPIVGNAAEHVTAVTVAMKNKMDLSIGVAVGSSIQIAVLVIPLLVILGWIIGQPMSLYFQTFETVALFISVIIADVIISDGSSNWLEGTMLMAAYVILAAAFFYHD